MTEQLGCLRWVVLLAAGTFALAGPSTAESVEQWDMFELRLEGPSKGNPFLDVEFSTRFTSGEESITATGFYDGDGIYRVRCMPDRRGPWQYETRSNVAELHGRTGRFEVTPPSTDNHGPIHVANAFHFSYADGTPFKQIGTTCYAWIHQEEALQQQTLQTLAESPFNKIRFCVFPKRYAFNQNEPPLYPFEGTPPSTWDKTRFNPAFFQHLERRVADLRDLGIEADVILLHPYDGGHWGFDRMTAEEDDRYLRYVVARLAAYRNVWWSLANEYDFMDEKQEPDWNHIGEVVARADPHDHLLSIHNGSRLFNHTRDWITHASIQNGSAVEDAGRAVLYRDVYRKPIVFDEVKYEGNIPQRWGNLSAEEMVHRFWQGTMAGTYVGHGETYLSDDDILWWSKGGVLKGDSRPRLTYLRKILEEGPSKGLEPIDKWQHPEFAGAAPDYYLVYFGKSRPTRWAFKLPRARLVDVHRPGERMQFQVDLLDTWNMTTEAVEGRFTIAEQEDYFYADVDGRSVALPGRPYMALRILRVSEEQGSR